VYQSSFEPSTKCSEEFAKGAEILKYWQGVTEKYDVYCHLKLETTVRKA
jgi:cation diffusion facilitator CzcD-associated flavoprotein CzcO